MDASSSSSSATNRPNRYVYCHCGEKLKVMTSWTSRNPGRRFVRCPHVKTRFCTTFRFIDEELPNQYYKDLLFDLRSQTQNQLKYVVVDEEEVSSGKSKANFYEKCGYVMFGFLVMFSIIITLVLLN